MSFVQSLSSAPPLGKKKSLRIAFFTILHEFLFDLLVSPLKSLFTKNRKAEKTVYYYLIVKHTTYYCKKQLLFAFYFEATRQREQSLAGNKTKNALQNQMDTTDRQVDRLVYKLYDLAEAEIRIVEESLK